MRTPGYLFQTFNCPKEAHEGFGEDKAHHEGAELENPGLGYSLDLNCIRMISPGNAGGDPVVPETNEPEQEHESSEFFICTFGTPRGHFVHFFDCSFYLHSPSDFWIRSCKWTTRVDMGPARDAYSSRESKGGFV